MSAPCRHAEYDSDFHRVKLNLRFLFFKEKIISESDNTGDYQHRSLAAPKGGRDESFSAWRGYRSSVSDRLPLRYLCSNSCGSLGSSHLDHMRGTAIHLQAVSQ